MENKKIYKGIITYIGGNTKTRYTGKEIKFNKISLNKGLIIGNLWVNPNNVFCIEQWEVKR